jgi:polyhydroxybutyrate depolymerase
MLARWTLPFAFLLALSACSDETPARSPVVDEDDDATGDTTDDDDDNVDDGDDDGDDADPPKGTMDGSIKPPRDAGKDGSAGDGGKRDGGDTSPGDAGLGGLDAAVARDAGDTADASKPPKTVDASRPDATTPVDPPPTGTPGAAEARTITVGGVRRSYLLYIPKSVAKDTSVPLVSVHHGFTMSGKIMEDITSWKKVAEREKFVVAFPEGGGSNPWNVGTGVCGAGAFVGAANTQDDIAFVRALVADVDDTQPINDDQVFVGGFSMGGYFANNIGCKGKDVVRAISAHSGGTYSGSCAGDPIPVLIIHGDADGLISYDCGRQARDQWVSRNRCQTAVDSETIEGGKCEWSRGCREGAEVGFCTLNGMDHGWAGATWTGPWLSLQYGGGEQFEDAAEMMWKFFKTYL